ncbi:MAG: hypothetical protein AMS27_07505, partial [Bacteroides sp. SM23_62_1]
MSNKVNIEDLYRSHFDRFTAEPSAGLWTRIRYKLMWNEFFRFSLNTFNAYYLAAAVLVTTGGILLISSLFQPDIPEAPMAGEQMPSEEMTAPLESDVPGQPGVSTEQRTSRLRRQKEATSETKSGEDEKGTVTQDKKVKGDGKEAVTGADAATESKVLKESAPDTEGTGKTDKLLVSVGFEMSKQSGCAPLAVSFYNRSENAEKYLWAFGDGGNSQEKNPNYIFDEPGDYTVSLKITGADGKEYAATSKVVVHVTPKAQFELEDDVTIQEGQPVYFYNYSRDADYYEWDFGDQTRSRQHEPIHYYDVPGRYDVKLKVWTAQQCYDSITIINALTPSEQGILFPNAFTPNMDGPVGGYYQVNDPRNEVFYPIITGEIVEYQLRIYNRTGVQVFESNDVNIGWDGYYQDQLSAQGVY